MGKKLKEREIAVSGKPQIEKIFLDNHGKLRKQVKINRIKRKVTYEFRNDGTTLIGLLGIGDTLMTILQGTASFPKHVTAALLSALYSDTYGGYQYSYSYNEIVSAVESAVNGDYGKVDDLDEILQALQGSSGKDDDNSVRVVR